MENTTGVTGGRPPETNAQQQVSTPAILLMVAGALSGLYALVSIVRAAVSKQELPRQLLDDPNFAPYRDMTERLTSTGAGVLFGLIGLGLSSLIFFGGLKMKNLESYGLAMAAAILAIIPFCNPCYCVGIPGGIWALIVLAKPEVKAAFR